MFSGDAHLSHAYPVIIEPLGGPMHFLLQHVLAKVLLALRRRLQDREVKFLVWMHLLSLLHP